MSLIAKYKRQPSYGSTSKKILNFVNKTIISFTYLMIQLIQYCSLPNYLININKMQKLIYLYRELKRSRSFLENLPNFSFKENFYSKVQYHEEIWSEVVVTFLSIQNEKSDNFLLTLLSVPSRLTLSKVRALPSVQYSLWLG